MTRIICCKITNCSLTCVYLCVFVLLGHPSLHFPAQVGYRVGLRRGAPGIRRYPARHSQPARHGALRALRAITVIPSTLKIQIQAE